MRSSIVDASVIIRLARLGYLEFLFKLFDKVYVTEIIEKEVLVDKYPEFNKIKEFLKKTEVVKIDVGFNDLRNIIKLDYGELSCLYFAKCKDVVFLTDDYDAMIFARKFLEIKSYGTVRIIIELVRRGVINRDEGKTILKNIRELSGLWINDEIIKKALKML